MGLGVSNLAGNLLSGADNGVAGGAYVVILRGNAGGIVSSTRVATTTRKAPRSVAAVDAVLEAGKITGIDCINRAPLVAAVFEPSNLVIDSRFDGPATSSTLVVQLLVAGNSGIRA